MCSAIAATSGSEARLARDAAKAALVHGTSANQRHSEAAAAGSGRACFSGFGLDPIHGPIEGRCGGTLSAWGSDQLGASEAFASPDGPGWFVDRRRFDAVLRTRCVALGATLVTGRTHDLRRAARGDEPLHHSGTEPARRARLPGSSGWSPSGCAVLTAPGWCGIRPHQPGG